MGEQHTALPWRSEANAYGRWFVYGDLDHPHSNSLGTVWNTLVCGGDNALVLKGEDARLIVTAVNTYPAVTDLVNALETLIQYSDWTVGPESPGHHPTLPSAIGVARSALSRFRELQGGENDR